MSQTDRISNHSNQEELDLTLTPCAACKTTSTENEPMVGCDSCDNWFHYRCVNVTEAVKKEKRWFCKETARQEAAKKYQKKTDTKKKKSETVPTLEQKLKYMEEEHKKRLEEWDMERILEEREKQFKLELKEKQMQQEQELKEQELDREKKMLSRALADKVNYLRRMKCIRDEYEEEVNIMDENARGLGLYFPVSVSNVNAGKPPITESLKRNQKPKKLNKQEVASASGIAGADFVDHQADQNVDGSSSSIPKKNREQVDSQIQNGLGQQHADPPRCSLQLEAV
ncbi:uncharacterized protein LOC129732145 [Wyeomyia smithii]|uniref:uncharacterized protein LOC129732145 n=1 Tax=Wyeomyia smithii TaxID=174621 RepID=UPI002467BD0F|nr:uncharacterized protein LOC129732145 [Wyeomyia smithii]